MIKRLLVMIMLLLLCISSLASCGPVNATTSEPIPVEKRVHFNTVTDLGGIRIVSIPRFAQSKNVTRENEIAKIVCERILSQRNIKMDFDFIQVMPVLQQLYIMDHAGDLPEIVLRQCTEDANSSNEILSSPLRLNETLVKYGPNLARIPDTCFEMSKIADSIVAIPSIELSSFSIFANNSVMQKYGWQIPKTYEEFEQLLYQAKEKIDAPIMNTPYCIATWFNIPIDNYLFNPYLYCGQDGLLKTYQQTPEYQTYIDTLLRWKKDGLMKDGEFEKDEWLFTEQPFMAVGYMQDVEPLKPMTAVNGAPAVSLPLRAFSNYYLESYHKPEALVTLMDWTIANESNYGLITRGEEGVDFTFVSNDVYKQNDGSQWEFQNYLRMDGLYSRPLPGMFSNTNVVDKAIEYANESTKPISRYSLPLSSQRYALPGSRLKNAWYNRNEYEFNMWSALNELLQGRMTPEEYAGAVKGLESLVEDYVKLSQDYLYGKYDPLKDMYQAR